MAEFVTVMHEYTRMCDRNMRCENCPIGKANDGSGIACHSFMRQFPEGAERIIMQWAEENPIMTNRRKFKEIFGFDVATVFEINRTTMNGLMKNIREMIAMDKLDEAIANTAYILDCLRVLRSIYETGDCNNCGIKAICDFKPKPGQMVRYNCPFYEKDGD